MRIDKSFFISFLILLCIFLGALSPSLTFLFIALSGILSILLFNSQNKNICCCIILLLCFQNFAIGCGAHLTSNSSSTLKFLTQVPFLTIAIIWFFSIIKTKCFDKKFILYIITIILSFIIGRGKIEVILISLRNLIVFYMAYYIGKQYIKNKDDLDKFYDFIMKLSFFMLVSGIVLLIGWYKLYNIIGINEVYIAKGSNPLNGYMNARFYTDIFHIDFRRMGSLYYEPVNLAYFYAANFIFSLYYKKRNEKYPRLINILINGLGLLLCFGKGGYLIVIFTVSTIFIYKFIKKIIRRIKSSFALKSVSCLILILGIIFSVKYYTLIGGSVKPHFWGVINTYNSVLARPFGYGLGTGGNMYALLNNNTENWLSSGGESGFMVVMYQLGLQGIIAFVICFLGTSKNIVKLDDNFSIACKILPFILLIISLLQENTYTPQCITLFMMIIGAANNLFIENKGENL